jgi:hypothetical protein
MVRLANMIEKLEMKVNTECDFPFGTFSMLIRPFYCAFWEKDENS